MAGWRVGEGDARSRPLDYPLFLHFEKEPADIAEQNSFSLLNFDAVERGCFSASRSTPTATFIQRFLMSVCLVACCLRTILPILLPPRAPLFTEATG